VSSPAGCQSSSRSWFRATAARNTDLHQHAPDQHQRPGRGDEVREHHQRQPAGQRDDRALLAPVDHEADADREKLEVRNLGEYFPSRSYGVVVRKGKFLSPQARAFADLVKPGLFERRGYDDPGHSER
jgi:hypothetical protein